MLKSRVLLIVFMLFLSSLVNAQNKNLRLLKKAFRKDSKELLHTFFENWDQEIPQISEAEFAAMNDTVQQAYSVFESFYSPRNLTRLVGSKYSEPYTKVNFLLVQNRILVHMRDQVYYSDQEIDSVLLSNVYRIHEITEDDVETKEQWRNRLKTDRRWMIEAYGPIVQFNDKSTDTLLCLIDDFRPRIRPDSSALYLSLDYEIGLSNFLGEYVEPQGFPSEKQQFLEREVDISQGTFGSWDLSSYPTAVLYFDKNFEYCMVRFRIHMSGGEAMMKRNGESWEFISSNQTWIY